ncbi:MAG: 50S ribosomal protein L24 [Thermoplasmata archaeon]|nr:50S ribosomal protein L24 [Thermoplasmata archaeon]
MNSRQPRKQRKNMHNAPLHHRRKWLASHLAEDLIVKYNKRSMPVVRGDTVKVVRGNFKNHVDKVREVDLKKQLIEVEGVVTTKVDGSKVPRPIHPSNVLITKLNLTDPWRREKLERGLSEEAKKEIEEEAKRQIEEEKLEEERRKQEEARKAAEEEAAEEEKPEEQVEEEVEPAEEMAEPEEEVKEEPEAPAEEEEPKAEEPEAPAEEEEPEKEDEGKQPPKNLNGKSIEE